jgi:hypothetical protein
MTLIIILIQSLLLTISGCGGGVGDSGTNTPGNSAILTWEAPTTNSDGTILTDLDGYKVYYGTSPGTYGTPLNVGNVTTYTIGNLSSGTTYYFAVTAIDISGNESDYSNEVSKTI